MKLQLCLACLFASTCLRKVHGVPCDTRLVSSACAVWLLVHESFCAGKDTPCKVVAVLYSAVPVGASSPTTGP
jgi:hypothetical protein